MSADNRLAKVVIRKGATIPFGELPGDAIALDGYVQGPAIDADRRRYSFDHHGNCLRHATLSTCEMTLDALRVGLDPAGLSIYVNDLDADTTLAAWLLLTPQAAQVERVVAAVRSLGRLDALGPTAGTLQQESALRWALAPLTSRGDLRTHGEPAWRAVLGDCLERLDLWLAAGAPQYAPEMPAEEEAEPQLQLLFDGGPWQLLQSDGGVGAFAAVYRRGVFAAVVARPLADGTLEYTVGKASEFVGAFDVPAILAALAVAEREVNPGQSAACSWGGSSTIGGSPRNPDGSASRLGPMAVAGVVEASRAGGA